jgi:hypothetical protein
VRVLQVNDRGGDDTDQALKGEVDEPSLPVYCMHQQVLIVQCGGPAFQTSPLNGPQWGLCVGLGAVTLLVRAALLAVPTQQQQQQQGLVQTASLGLGQQAAAAKDVYK